MLAKESIARHFSDRGSPRSDDLVHRAAYPLVGMIVEERDLRDVKALMRFVEEPENLRPWLPSRKDRVVLSGTIRRGLEELAKTKADPHRR